MKNRRHKTILYTISVLAILIIAGTVWGYINFNVH